MTFVNDPSGRSYEYAVEAGRPLLNDKSAEFLVRANRRGTAGFVHVLQYSEQYETIDIYMKQVGGTARYHHKFVAALRSRQEASAQVDELGAQGYRFSEFNYVNGEGLWMAFYMDLSQPHVRFKYTVRASDFPAWARMNAEAVDGLLFAKAEACTGLICEAHGAYGVNPP